MHLTLALTGSKVPAVCRSNGPCGFKGTTGRERPFRNTRGSITARRRSDAQARVVASANPALEGRIGAV